MKTLSRTQIEDYMVNVFGCDKETIEEYKQYPTDNLLDMIDTELRYTDYPDEPKTSVEAVNNYLKEQTN